MPARGKAAIAVLLIGAVVAVAVTLSHHEPVADQVRTLRPASAGAPAAGVSNGAKPRGTAELGVPASEPSVLGQPLTARFSRYSGDDVLQFIENLLPAARGGNAEAQFAIHESLLYCDEGYRAFYDRPGKRRTLDEALQWASTRPAINIDEVSLTHAKCSVLMERERTELGRANEWLMKSADAGLPQAQARAAVNLLFSADWGFTPGGQSPESQIKDRDLLRNEGRELMLRALNSGDASVTWQVGEAILPLTRSEDLAYEQQYVWYLAACLQGLDCSPQADWFIFQCRQDPYCQPGETGVDYLHRNGEGGTQNLDEAAARLLARLKRGNIDMAEFEKLLGMGSR